MRRRMKTLLKLGVGLALSGLTLYLFLRNLDFEKVRAGLAGANVPLLLVAILLGYFGHLALRSLRWATMLQPLKVRAAGDGRRETMDGGGGVRDGVVRDGG